MASLAVALGFLALIGSIFFSALLGQQVAIIGLGFILIGIFLELRSGNKQPVVKKDPFVDQFAKVQKLIDAKQYDEARILLMGMNHPQVGEWLQYLHKLGA